jgi:hypothetical protein
MGAQRVLIAHLLSHPEFNVWLRWRGSAPQRVMRQRSHSITVSDTMPPAMMAAKSSHDTPRENSRGVFIA